MKRRCVWSACGEPATKTVGYWGEKHDLCAEHADLIGDDGSVTEQLESVN